MAIVPSTEWNRMKAGFRKVSSDFTTGQKAMIALAVVGAIVAVVVVASFVGRPSYSVLFSGVQGQDAAKITQQLTADHIPYQLQDGGSTILVPANDVAQARLNAASTGLPSQGTVGLSLLTKAGLTTSQITQQADYLQAIQGELEQTIDAISGVESSQVNVAEPANQTFALSNTAPTGASVLVTMSQGHTLSDNQVQTIVHLVASSVPGLTSQNVTVADSNGDLLSGPGVSASSSNSSTTAKYETAVQTKVAAYLASIVGPNNADVQVDATLDFDKVKTTTHQIAPPVKGAKTSFCTATSQTTTTYTSKGAKAVGGTAGTITNAKAGTATGGNYNQTKTSKTCETGTVTTTTTQTPGSVVKQSVAVLLNRTAIPKGTNLAAIKKGVAAAANLDTARGDVLAFTVAPFSTAAARQAAVAARQAASTAGQERIASLARDGVALLAVLALLFFLWRASRKRRVAREPIDYGPRPYVMPPAPAVTDVPTAQIPAVSQGAAQLAELVGNQPNEVASYIRTWLSQHQGSEGGGD